MDEEPPGAWSRQSHRRIRPIGFAPRASVCPGMGAAIDRNPAGARFRAAKRKRTVKASGTKVRFLNPEQARAFLVAVGGSNRAKVAAVCRRVVARERSGVSIPCRNAARA